MIDKKDKHNGRRDKNVDSKDKNTKVWNVEISI